jgi:hypothetical protein
MTAAAADPCIANRGPKTLLDFDMGPCAAMDAPRTPPLGEDDAVLVEDRLSPDPRRCGVAGGLR